MAETSRLGYLSELIDFRNGKAVTPSVGDVPIYGGNGILGYGTAANYGACVVVGRVGAYCGSTHLENAKCWVSDNALAGVPRQNSCNQYNYYLLKALRLNERQIGSSQPLLTQGILNSIQVTIEFDPSRQRQIAAVLSALDAKIELNNRINAELEALAKTIYDYWFVQFDFPDANGRPWKSSGGAMVWNDTLKREIPAGWEAGPLGKWISFQRGISYRATEIGDGGTPLINLNSFRLDGSVKLDGTKYYSGEFRADQRVRPGDLVIAITDVTRNADITGRAFVVPDLFGESPLISCDVAAVHGQPYFPAHYLERLFNSEHYHNYLKPFASGTLVLHLNLDGVRWFESFLPTRPLLDRYEAIAVAVRSQVNANLAQNRELTQLRDWLLPLLMNGQVRVA